MCACRYLVWIRSPERGSPGHEFRIDQLRGAGRGVFLVSERPVLRAMNISVRAGGREQSGPRRELEQSGPPGGP